MDPGLGLLPQSGCISAILGGHLRRDDVGVNRLNRHSGERGCVISSEQHGPHDAIRLSVTAISIYPRFIDGKLDIYC
jgi:hypothetical protein